MAQGRTTKEVHVLSTDVESILYGAFFVMYWACALVLIKWRNALGINKTMLLAVTAMMVIATLFEAVSIQRDVEALFRHKDSPPGASYISSNWTRLYQSSLWIMQLLIGGSLLVYRMYVVYARRLWLVALPMLLVTASAVCGANATYQLSQNNASNGQKFVGEGLGLTRWTTGLVALNMSQSVISSISIASRLWWTDRKTGKRRRGKYWAVILESGLLYTLTLIIFTVLHFRDQRVAELTYCGTVPLTGLWFTGLAIHVNLRQHRELNCKADQSHIEPTYPHKITSYGYPGAMTFAPPQTQTQGTTLSTFTESSQAFSGSTSAPDLEKAVPPAVSSSSGLSMSTDPQSGEEFQRDRPHTSDKPAKSEGDLRHGRD